MSVDRGFEDGAVSGGCVGVTAGTCTGVGVRLRAGAGPELGPGREVVRSFWSTGVCEGR